MTDAQSGYLFLADISGYTSYLNESELEHARDTLTDLLELLIDHAKPPLTISKLEGDAVFSYTLGDDSFQDGQAMVELIENTYVAFRRAIELMVMNNTCRCAACANVSMLDLKFFVHHGIFVKQDFGRQVELVGTDVNLIHRLMKNNVKRETGFAAYTLYTEAAVRQLGIEAMTETMRSHDEFLDDLGNVRLWVHDMHPVWEERREEDHVDFEPMVTAAVDIALPPEVVWSYLRRPEYRSVIVGADRVALDNRQAGRIGPEGQFQCFHGDHVLRQVIVEWTPFERIVSQDTDTMPLMNKLTWKNEYMLVPKQSGTHLTISLGDFEGSRLVRKLVTTFLSRGAGQIEDNLREFAAMAEADWADQHARVGDLTAPELTSESIRDAAASSLNGLRTLLRD